MIKTWETVQYIGGLFHVKSLFPSYPFPLSSPTCVPKSKIQKSYNEGYKTGYGQADHECLMLQQNLKTYVENLQKENQEKTNRLKKFNQVDEKGQLRNKKSEKDLKKLAEEIEEVLRLGPNPVDGSEEWQK